jgi:hypothetical protein
VSTNGRAISSSSRLRLQALSLGTLALLAACTEQKIQTGFEGDVTAPVVSIQKTFKDTMDVQVGLRFSISAADNLGLKTVSTVLTGGFTSQIDTTFRSAVTTATLPINVTFPKNTTAGGWVYIKVTATDGNNNSSVANDSIYLTNIDALIVQLVRPLPNAVTSGGKQVLIQVQANQKQGIKKIGWIAANAVTGSDSVLYAPPGLKDTVLFTDTLAVPAALTSGTFTVQGFAEDSSGRRALTQPTTVTIQSVASDNTPPTVSFTVANRVEVRDTITVRAGDPSGIIKIGWLATDRFTGATVGGDSVTASGALTDVTQAFSLNLNFATFPQQIIVKAFAVDAANNRGEATVGASPTAPVVRDTITVVNGITKPLPQGGLVRDAIYNRNLNEIYLTNTNSLGQGVVEIFSVTDTSFKTPVFVGALPWGIALWPRDTLGNNADTVVVANSGGTNLSVVSMQARREVRRHKLPNFLIQSVKTKIQPNTSVINLEITEYDFSDRPQFLGMFCRPTGGTACPTTRTYAVYSTFPTAGQSGIFPNRGSIRWENMDPTANESHFFWEQASISAKTSADTLQVVIDRGPGTPLVTDLSAACGVMVDLTELGFMDTTFVRSSGNFTHAIVGEGGSGNAALGFARVLGYNGITGVTTAACSGTIAAGTGGGVTFTGPGNTDNGVSPGIRVRDFIANTAIPVKSVAINFNGLTNLVRADRVYTLDAGLRLMGIIDVEGTNPGMDLNFNHAFDAGCGGTAGSTGIACSPNGLSPNDRIMFAARPDATIDAMDTFFYGRVASIAVRDPITGPLRVAKLPTGEQILVGATARGIVTVRLPAITNVYQARMWGAPTP